MGCLIGGHRAGPGAWTSDRATHLDLLQHWHEPGAVSGLATGEHERQRAAASIRGQVDLARQPAARPPEIGSRQAGTMPTPHLPELVELASPTPSSRPSLSLPGALSHDRGAVWRETTLARSKSRYTPPPGEKSRSDSETLLEY